MQKLLLSEDIFDALDKGKLITIRKGRRDIDLGDLVFQSTETKRQEVVKVSHVYYSRLKEVLIQDLKDDGFKDHQDMLTQMQRFYPSLTLDDVVTTVRFIRGREFRFDHIVKITPDRQSNVKIYLDIKADSEFILDNHPNEHVEKYIEDRDKIFSEELKDLFYSIGINPNKDNEFIFYQTDKLKITEVWFDFIGEFNFKSSEKSTFYEKEEYTVNIFFDETSTNAIRKEFKNHKTNRIVIAIVKE